MTTTAQLYLNEQAAERGFEEQLAALVRENARLQEALARANSELIEVRNTSHHDWIFGPTRA